MLCGNPGSYGEITAEGARKREGNGQRAEPTWQQFRESQCSERSGPKRPGGELQQRTPTRHAVGYRGVRRRVVPRKGQGRDNGQHRQHVRGSGQAERRPQRVRGTCDEARGETGRQQHHAQDRGEMAGPHRQTLQGWESLKKTTGDQVTEFPVNETNAMGRAAASSGQLPAPLSPTGAHIAPRGILRERGPSANVRPNVLRKPRMLIADRQDRLVQRVRYNRGDSGADCPAHRRRLGRAADEERQPPVRMGGCTYASTLRTEGRPASSCVCRPSAGHCLCRGSRPSGCQPPTT